MRIQSPTTSGISRSIRSLSENKRKQKKKKKKDKYATNNKKSLNFG